MTTRELLGDWDVILASASPRRKELMQLITHNFRVVPADCDESLPADVRPENAARLLAERKCACVADCFKTALVIGCDTVVVCDDEILGKPRDEEDARRMIRLLGGREHFVYTGVCFIRGSYSESFSVATKVVFRELSEDEVQDYIQSGEYKDKAGAYGIQGYGSLLAERIEGDFFNVVGLPVSELNARLKAYAASEVRG